MTCLREGGPFWPSSVSSPEKAHSEINSEGNNTPVSNEKDLDVMMPNYNLIEYSKDDCNDNMASSEIFKTLEKPPIKFAHIFFE